MSILGLLCAICLLNPGYGYGSGDTAHAARQTEDCTLQNNSPESQQKQLMFELSDGLKKSACVAPRGFQLPVSSPTERTCRNITRFIRIAQLKEDNNLHKTSETVSVFQTINHSSLLCRSGYHIYALRKIII